MIFKPEDLLPGCLHFTHRDALWLPQWNRLANASDGLNDTVMANLIVVFQKLERIREFLGSSIAVHCAYRPKLYNAAVRGAKASAHITGQAVDWSPSEGGMSHNIQSCAVARGLILTGRKLEELGLRMEDAGIGSNWVHVDIKPVPPGGNRFFKP
jgi:hypothetical protein